MIEFVNLTKYYPTRFGRYYVFRDLNFRFPDGINVGLMGLNGAGKSTLMRIMAGLSAPSRGHFRCDKTISWPVGSGAGLQGSLTPRDNARFVCRLFGLTRREVEERVEYVERFAEIGNFFDMPLKACSSGMRGRVAFGLSMAFDFDYYLIDEAMAAGDATFRARAKATFESKIARSNVIMVSHNIKDIQEMCHNVVILHDGQATLYENVAEGLDIYMTMQKKIKQARSK
ncbi:ABC transporter ATP-binding protein [Ideonella livida]|uniref:ABC transporter ATP-binding protein n=1 Tax=Ideonella livida TaxID=2707176 RepID=A0A7C9TI13_9BURK|nr:ABC transporter ATP-binding protein [Ideonella livida]NDY90900.1 ABC transporter ATP-binding protein [Ideonella livida]